MCLMTTIISLSKLELLPNYKLVEDKFKYSKQNSWTQFLAIVMS